MARLTLIWLLAVALPLQGASAATMLACGVAPSVPAQAPHVHHAHPMSIDVMATGGMSFDAMSIGAMHDHSLHEVAPAHSAAEGPPFGKSQHPDPVHKCGTCASCCLGAFVASRPTVFASAELTHGYRPLITGTLPAFLTPGIERPPRSFLA